MRANAAAMCLGILLTATGAWAQSGTQAQVVSSTQHAAEASSPDYSAVYCSNFVTDEKVPDDFRMISGEESNAKVTFSRGENVYLSRGSAQGVHVGDRFSIVRPTSDALKAQWFKWQDKLMKAMGSMYEDVGQVQVVVVHPNVSIAQVAFACDYLQRGDIVRPMQERPSPPYKPSSAFDNFAPVSGKSVGMLVVGQDYSQSYGKNNIVYVNIGTNQGTKVGDYLRVFRYQGSMAEIAANTKNYHYEMYGFGSTPVRYQWNDLPREVLGEGIVVNVSRNSATIFITYSRNAMFAGDYVEIE
jgi:hypothetical protein